LSADRLAALPLDAVAEVLVLLEPALDDLRRQAAFRARARARRQLAVSQRRSLQRSIHS
jgi:hypothetical protein